MHQPHQLQPQKAVLSTGPKLQKAQAIKLPPLAASLKVAPAPAAVPSSASVSALPSAST
jgi:hypothetical protein